MEDPAKSKDFPTLRIPAYNELKKMEDILCSELMTRIRLLEI